MTSTGVFTEEMWRATYWTDESERAHRKAHHVQELFGKGMQWLEEQARSDNVTGALGAFGHSQHILQTLIELRSGVSSLQGNREKSAVPTMMYCVKITQLDERKLCHVTVRLSTGRADYAVNAVPVPSAEDRYLQYFAVAAPVPAVPVTLLTSTAEASVNAVYHLRYLYEPKESAMWLVRDADTLWSINSTAFTITIRNKENATCHHVSTMTNFFGEFSLSLPRNGGYWITIGLTGYYPIALRNFKLNSANGMTFMEPLMFINKRFTGSGSASGTVYSIPSTTYPNPLYEPLADADLTFVSLDQGTLGQKITTAKTTATGTWKADLPTGLYALAISKSGFIPAAFTIAVLGGKEKSYDTFSVTPVLSQSSMRIVLFGDASISFDLDLHVRGPVEGNGSRFHVFHGSQSSSDNLAVREVEIGSKPYQSTIIKRQLAGIYRVSVFDWTNRGRTNSWVLANSRAMLHIYRGSSLLETYFVPNREGNTWDVVEISGINLAVKNIVHSITPDHYPLSFDSD